MRLNDASDRASPVRSTRQRRVADIPLWHPWLVQVWIWLAIREDVHWLARVQPRRSRDRCLWCADSATLDVSVSAAESPGGNIRWEEEAVAEMMSIGRARVERCIVSN